MLATDAGPEAEVSTSISSFVEEARLLVGCEATDVPAGVAVAGWLPIQRFVEAMGDDNPLYMDAYYGAASQHRTMLAPPTFVLAVRSPASVGPLYDKPCGFLNLLTHVEIEQSDNIHLGERLRGDLRIEAACEGPEWRGRQTAQVVSRASYTKDGNRPFAQARGTVTMYPLRRGQEAFVGRGIYSYSDAEIDAIERDLDAEQPRRGAVPRFWDDTSIGDPLPVLVKGPLTLSDLLVWAMAEGKPVKLGSLLHRELAEQPGRVGTNPTTLWPYWDTEQGREDLQSCADAGFPGPYGRGEMRVALAGHLITHWMGDDAFLRRLSVSLPNPFIYGDTMWLSGVVGDKSTAEHGGHTYYAGMVEFSGKNQLGETVLEGSAEVFLPRPGRPVLLPVAG